MDVSNLVNYEHHYPLELVHPVTEEKIGITVQIRSVESDEAKRVLRKQLDKLYERRQRGKMIKGSAEIDREVEKVAACIAGWDWGDNTWHGEKPEFSTEKATEIPHSEGWIFGQVNEAANDISNFTPASATSSGKRSV
ncbi:hypothetical protein [Pararhizobium mangrovi]|uniref:Uncharacterized protein n=1 Tax=Pararhizobium mangrovi TaxID=2590452 RepID=A0A506TXJ7_9HYPH|nr:hypothetical protein [Pararhizobium mangrovi]TPW26036.1 hypothetical protein FJU11_16615 [Pararhizobium mangrovi]